MNRIRAAFERLLDAAYEQVTALDQASVLAPTQGHAYAPGSRLWRALERVDRFAVLIVVQTAGERPARWGVAWQRWLTDKLAALHGRAAPLLARTLPDGEIQARRFATRLSVLDPLARFRTGPDRIVDVAGKLITGRSPGDARRYFERERGAIESLEAVIARVSLRDADLSMGDLSTVRMLDLDARGANLDAAIALEARLSRVNLAGASMRDVDLQSVLARDCDFSDASLMNARWHDGTAVLCSFVQAALTDLSADRAMFLHCDFRGADLTVGGGGASVTMTGAQFLDCDLRGSRWNNRTLNGIRFVGCKLYGVTGAPCFDGVLIDKPDLSPAGDGSQTGSLTDVLALWRMAAGERVVSRPGRP